MMTTSTPESPLRSQRRLVAAAVLSVLVAVATLSDLLFGLDRVTPFVQVVAFRPQILVCLMVSVAGLTVWKRKRAWPFIAGLLTVLLVGAAVTVPRMVADVTPTTGRALTVLTANVRLGQADVRSLANLIVAERPNAVTITEAGDAFRDRLAPLVQPMGYRLFVSNPGERDVNSNIMLLAESLGDVQVRPGQEGESVPYLEATGGGLGDLRLVAYHAVWPVPHALPRWRRDLALLQRWCTGPTPAIVAGDFNATLDHSVFRDGTAGCTDVAEQRGAGLISTWGPTEGLRPFGPQVDHVLVTTGIAAEAFSVHDIAESDHGAVLTRLRRL